LTTIRRARWALTALVAAAFTVGALAARAQPPGKPAARPGAKVKGRVPRKAPQPPNARDPLAGDPAKAPEEPAGGLEAGTYHYALKVRAADGTPLSASYYPPVTQDTNTPAVLLVHEKDRSGKDFEDPIAELKGVGLSEHLQGLGYAVLQVDLRGQGANVRKPLNDRDWVVMIDDLQTFYLFLLDRHNRGEINLAKLGAVALGEGANLVAAWAHQPGGAVSGQNRVTDLSGMALVSPLPSGSGYGFPELMSTVASRIPVLLMVGERDAPSHDTVKRVKAGVEKTRQNKVELYPSSLHGYKLLRLEPGATAHLARFLEATVKLRAAEWEPRYNLTPVPYNDIQVIRHKDQAKAKAAEPPKADEPAAKKGEPAPPKGDPG